MKIAVLAIMLCVANANADVAEPTAEPVESTSLTPYGESYPVRIILADAGSLASFGLGGMFLVGAALGGDSTGGLAALSAAFVTAGILGYVVGPPLLHAGRGNPRGAMRSAITRAGVPLAGGMLAYLSDRRAEGDVVIYGVVGGIGCAMILDWVVFARMPAGSTPFVAPAADGGVQAGIAARF